MFARNKPAKLSRQGRLAVAGATLSILSTMHQPASAQIGGALRDLANSTPVEFRAASGPESVERNLASVVEYLRMTGEWESPLGRIIITRSRLGSGDTRPNLFGHIFFKGATAWTEFEIANSNGRTVGKGVFPGIGSFVHFTMRLLDDDSLEFATLSQGSVQGRSVWTALRSGTPATSPLAGTWQTNLGKLVLRPEGYHLLGTIEPATGGSEGRRVLALERYTLEGQPIKYWKGAWRPQVTGVAGAGMLRFEPADDGQSFSGTYSRWNGSQMVEAGWTGRRLPAASGAPADPAHSPATQPVPRPQPAPPPTGPVAEAPVGGFYPLAKWDVRLDRVENPRDDRLTHVYLTLRNSGTADLFQTQNVWVYLESSDGLEQKSGQGLRALPGYPKLFDSPPPVVRPGKEIRAKFVFDRNEGGTPSKVTVEENGKQAEFSF